VVSQNKYVALFIESENKAAVKAAIRLFTVGRSVGRSFSEFQIKKNPLINKRLSLNVGGGIDRPTTLQCTPSYIL
jgi:hypothetical protein